MPTVSEAIDQIWSDPALKQRLITDPKPVLKGFGLEIPEGISVHVHENTNTVFNCVLPMKPVNPVSLGSDPLSQIIERTWSDAAFKTKVLTEPKEAAAEMGIKLPESVDVKVWENTKTDEHMVLPANPVETELSEMELEAVAGGALSKGSQAAAGCGVAGGVVGALSGGAAVAAAFAFTAVGALVATGLAAGAGVAAGVVGAASAAGGAIASGSGKC